MLFILLLISSLASFAQAPRRDLDTYIRMFSMSPLPELAPRREPLYQLGLKLFYDKKLSGKNNTSCGSCHALGTFSGDGLPLGVGEGAEGIAEKRHQAMGALLARHTPSLYNLGFPGVTALFWDGRVGLDFYRGGWATPEPGLNGPNPRFIDIAKTLTSPLAVQALFPISNPDEMLGRGSPLSNIEAWDSTMDRLLNGDMKATYNKLFSEAFPGVTRFNIGHVGNAIAELERVHFVANNTLWDIYLRGNKQILSERMKRGAIVYFTRGACINCHAGPHLTTFGYQNIGAPQIGPGARNGDDKGRAEFTGSPEHLYKFRVPPLRNIALTAPYMHSGAFSNMWQVIDHYDNPAASLMNFRWDPRHPRYRDNLFLEVNNNRARIDNLANNMPRALNLTPEEKTDLYCFLMVGLTDLRNQMELIQKGVLDEISDCSPRPAPNKRYYNQQFRPRQWPPGRRF